VVGVIGWGIIEEDRDGRIIFRYIYLGKIGCEDFIGAGKWLKVIPNGGFC
jgi:hypothetical protein